MGRGREGPKRFLGQFEGILQTDGYAAYEQVGGAKLVHAACWAHSRRKFFDAVKLNHRNPEIRELQIDLSAREIEYLDGYIKMLTAASETLREVLTTVLQAAERTVQE